MLKKIHSYIIGNYRYYLYYTIFKFLLRKHIIEQYEFRLNEMKYKCWASGACIECGCTTPNLQMSPFACEGNCYPDMMNKKQWIDYKLKNDI